VRPTLRLVSLAVVRLARVRLRDEEPRVRDDARFDRDFSAIAFPSFRLKETAGLQ
jgi:hypothetical protein